MPPAASVTVTQTAGDTVTADATASTPGSLPIAAYSYDWGDGTTTQDPSAQGTQTHQYTADGSYTIRVTAFDTAGRASAPASATLSVGPPTGPITLAGTSNCLTDSGTTLYVTSGKTVYISAVCDGDPSQQWTLAPNGELQNQGQCLVELDDADAAQYDLLEPCTGASWASTGIYTQLFYPQGDGTIIDRPDPGSQLTYCLAADASSGAITFTACASGAPGQSWTLPGYASASS